MNVGCAGKTVRKRAIAEHLRGVHDEVLYKSTFTIYFAVYVMCQSHITVAGNNKSLGEARHLRLMNNKDNSTKIADHR